MLIELIKNGNFEDGLNGWTGNDTEINPENSYLANGRSNRVAEMDGKANAITTMQQEFKVDEPGNATLSFRAALRNAAAPGTGEGFLVEILDSSGRVILRETVLPAANQWETYSFDVPFDTVGTYRLQLTELGPDQSLGAIVDDFSLLICFVSGTLILTDAGERPVEDLQVGDLVWTADAGMQPVLWVGRREVTLRQQVEDERLRPVVFGAGSLGLNQPRRDLLVSQQHRMVIQDCRNELYFGEGAVLVPAIGLVNGDDIRLAEPQENVTYVHFLLGAHQIVRAEGADSENFYPSANSILGVDQAARDEFFRLFPDLKEKPVAPARPVLRRFEGRLVA